MRLALVLLLVLTGAPAGAADQPRQDCGAAGFDEGGPVPRVAIYFGGDLDDWVPPACTGWAPRPFTVLVETEGLSARPESADDILARVGRISMYPEIRYWSATRERWRALVPSATALRAADPAATRGDFSAEELRTGLRHFWQEENTPLDAVTYALDATRAEDDRLVIHVTNALPARVSVFETLAAGRHAFFYALYRRPDGRWRIYGLMRTGNGPSIFAASGRRSYGNRAVALYRYLAGSPTAAAPPLFP